MTAKVSVWDYGAFSPLWMAKVLVNHLDRRSLNMAVHVLLDAADEQGELDAMEIFQIITQVGATNKLVETFYPEFNEDESLEGASEENTPTGLPTREEVDDFFNEYKMNKHKEDEEDDRSND